LRGGWAPVILGHVHCRSCGSALDSPGRFCGACGVAVDRSGHDVAAAAETAAVSGTDVTERTWQSAAAQAQATQPMTGPAETDRPPTTRSVKSVLVGVLSVAAVGLAAWIIIKMSVIGFYVDEVVPQIVIPGAIAMVLGSIARWLDKTE
jgi:hypothetical protein